MAEAIAHAAPVPFRVCRLVPAIPDVDTLDVVHKAQRIVLFVRADVGVLRSVGGIKPAAVRVETLSHGTGVSPARRRREVVCKGIGRAPGRVHLALERGDHRVRPDLTRRPGKKRRVDSRDGLELAELHRVRRVDHDDGALVVGTNITKKRYLLARELEVAARGVHRHVTTAGTDLVLLAGAVDALAGSAPNDDDRRVRVLLGIGKKVVGVAVLVVDARLVQSAELGRAAVQRAGGLVRPLAVEVAVHARELLVVLDAVVLERVKKSLGGPAHLPGAGPGGDPLRRRPAKDVHLGRGRGQGQRVVLIAKKDQALALDTAREVAAVVHDGRFLLVGDLDRVGAEIRIDGVAKEQHGGVGRNHRRDHNGGAGVADCL